MIGIEFCNLLEDDPFTHIQLDSFDAILAPHCLGALGSYDQQVRTIKNLCIRYLKPGGYFMILDIAEESQYEVSNKIFQWINIPADNFKTMCEESNLKIKTFHTLQDSLNGAIYPLDPNLGINVVVVAQY